MRLYEVPRNTRVRLLGELTNPPDAPEPHAGEVVNFRHIDGMYSFCTTDDGTVCHPAAWTEVEIVK